MFIKSCSRLAALGACVVLAGCATSRSEIALHSPSVVAPSVSSPQHAVVIGKVTDERVFEDSPSDPSTPSLGFGGISNADAALRSRAVARKRNGYGKALGDVLLQSGQTVPDVIRENLTAALEQAGYQVQTTATSGAPVIDVQIKTFWAWFDPGFFAITLSNNILTDLVFNGGTTIAVSTHVESKHQAATDNGWADVVDQGLTAWRSDVTHRLQGGDLAAAIGGAATSPMPLANSAAAQPAAPAAPVAPAAPAASMTPLASAMAVPPPTPSHSETPFAPGAMQIAHQLGCAAVHANGDQTYMAQCTGYSVLIDCGGAQCRPMHTVSDSRSESE